MQAGLLVSERKWCDFISYCGGMPMAVIRVYPDPKVQEAIVEAAIKVEETIAAKLATYAGIARDLIQTERKNYEEMRI